MSAQHMALRRTAPSTVTPSGVAPALAAVQSGPDSPSPLDGPARDARLRGLVDAHTDFLARVLRNAGIPHADIDDEVQRTFIIVSRRLSDVRAGSEKSFLLRTALHVAAHARRTVARRREVQSDEAPEMADAVSNPEQLTDQKRSRQMLDRALDQMDESLRTVFVLYEFEELNMAEIAGVLEIPAGTVASRLRRARVDFRERVRLIEGAFHSTAGKPGNHAG